MANKISIFFFFFSPLYFSMLSNFFFLITHHDFMSLSFKFQPRRNTDFPSPYQLQIYNTRQYVTYRFFKQNDIFTQVKVCDLSIQRFQTEKYHETFFILIMDCHCPLASFFGHVTHVVCWTPESSLSSLIFYFFILKQSYPLWVMI